MYGGRTKPESYCKITSYIEHNAPTLYGNIQDMCLFGMFNARGSNGVTFLLPDKKTRGVIDKLAGKDKTSALKAVDMIKACVLPIYLESTQDFETHKDSISNKLGHKLQVDTADASKVTLKNGTVIKKDPLFLRLYDNKKVNVFLLDGEVPVTGDAIEKKTPVKNVGDGYNALGSFDQEMRGGYTGGNNAEFETEFANVDHTWTAMFMAHKDQIKRRVKLNQNAGGVCSVMDPLSHGLVAIMTWLKYSNISEKTRRSDTADMYAAISETLPCSPLAYLFVGPLLSATQTKEWSDHNVKYNKASQLSEMYADGGGRNLEIDNIKKLEGATISRNTIVGVVKKTYALTYATLSDGAKRGAVAHWGSAENFRAWWMAMDEFCYLYSVIYTSAYTSGDIKTLTQVCHVYHNHVLPHAGNRGKGEWSKVLHLVSDTIDEGLFYQERFCTLFTFYFSHMCCSVGGSLTGITQYGAPVVYKWDEKPNSAQAWSFADIILSFWRNCKQLSDVR